MKDDVSELVDQDEVPNKDPVNDPENEPENEPLPPCAKDAVDA